LGALTNSRIVPRIVLWPVALIQIAAPEPHNIGTARDPFYEATPIDLLVSLSGLVLSVVIYTVILNFLLAYIQRRRSSG
jgi:hypothetical protein